MAGKNQITNLHLFILVPKFYCFYIKLNVFVILKFLKFKNLRIFLTVNYLKRSKTQIVNSLTASRLCAFLFYVDLACPGFRFKTFLYNRLAFCRSSIGNSIFA